MDGRRGANTTDGTGRAGSGARPRRTQSKVNAAATPTGLVREHVRNRGQNQRRYNRRPDRDSDTVARSSSSDHIHEDITLIRTSASRKGQISLTHMLNFTLPPRQPSGLSGPRRRRGHYTPFNKERFINANFRFIVRPSGDYTVQAVDPDVPIEWTDVEQVIIVTEEETVCPICLSKPVAPRVTRCGHIFCFSCILRYLATDTIEDDMRRKHEEGIGIAKRPWRKCPICWDPIMKNALRGVIFINGQSMPAVKQHLPTGSGTTSSTNHTTLRMRLIQRDSSSIFALPHTSQLPRQTNDALCIASTHTMLPWDAHPDALKFSKLSLASRDRYKMDLDTELAALQTAVKEAYTWQSPEEVPYMEAAMSVIRDKKTNVHEQWMANMDYAFEKMRTLWYQSKNDEKSTVKTCTPDMNVPKNEQTNASTESSSSTHWKHSSSEEEAHPFESFVDQKSPSIDITSSTTITPTTKQPSSSMSRKHTESAKASLDSNGKIADDFYFYQSDDGRYVFLHPIYMRALRQEYDDSPEKLPDIVQVTPLNYEESTVTEELRKRFKFISHLPLGCDITFIDIDLPLLVSSQTLSKFSAALHERKQRLKAKQRRERREHSRIERAMAQQQNNSARYAEYDASHFPAPSSTASTAITISTDVVSGETNSYDDASVQEAWATASANRVSAVENSPTTSQQFSFASALRTSAAEATSRQEEQRLSAWAMSIPEETRVNRKGKKTLVLMSNQGRRRR